MGYFLHGWSEYHNSPSSNVPLINKSNNTTVTVNGVAKESYYITIKSDYGHSESLADICIDEFSQLFRIQSDKVLISENGRLLTNIYRLDNVICDYFEEPATIKTKVEKIKMRFPSSDRRTNKKMQKYYVKNTVYCLGENVKNEAIVKKHTMKEEPWEVRGHWRHYKNGNKAWICSYTKGNKEKLKETVQSTFVL